MSSKIVSQNLTFGQGSELVQALVRQGLTSQGAQRLIEDQNLARQVVNLAQGSGEATPPYVVPVDYDLSVEQLVTDGQYDWANNSDISSAYFPLAMSGKAMIEMELVEIDRPLPTQTVLGLIDQRNLRRPNIKEGLSLGAWYPDLQRDGPIAILCQPSRGPGGGVHVPCLSRCYAARGLDLGWWGGVWFPVWRFAAVRRA